MLRLKDRLFYIYLLAGLVEMVRENEERVWEEKTRIERGGTDVAKEE